jgi:hypothetical protein
MAETELKLMDDDEVLDYTQLQRRQFINHFTQNGQTMPTDPKDAKVLLTALADMDRSALGKKRIRTDEQIAQMNAQSVDAIAAEVKRTMLGRLTEPDESRTPPTLDDLELPPLDLVDGETDVGVNSESYDAFKQRFESIHGKPKRRDD